MVIPFIAANFVLLAGLLATVYLSVVLPNVLKNAGCYEWLSVIASGLLTNVIIGTIYDALTPQISRKLTPGQANGMFSVASIFMVFLIYLVETNQENTLLEALFHSPQSQSIGLLAIGFCCYEVWEINQGKDLSERLLFSAFGGPALFYFMICAPFLVINSFLDASHMGFASFAAGWVASLASRLIRQFARNSELEGAASEKLVEGFLEKNIAVCIAVVSAYVYFKLNSTPTILFSMAVGALGAFMAHFLLPLIWHD